MKKVEVYIVYLGLVLALSIYCNPALARGVADESLRYRSLGYLYQEEGDLLTAIRCYTKAVSMSPKSATLRNDLGVAYEKLGNRARAERAYLKAIELNPEYAAAHSNLALLYESEGMIERAIAHWGIRVELGKSKDPWTKKARENLARLQLKLLGEKVEEEKLVEEAAKEVVEEEIVVFKPAPAPVIEPVIEEAEAVRLEEITISEAEEEIGELEEIEEEIEELIIGEGELEELIEEEVIEARLAEPEIEIVRKPYEPEIAGNRGLFYKGYIMGGPEAAEEDPAVIIARELEREIIAEIETKAAQEEE